MTETETYYSTCPSCGGMIDVSRFEPFSKVLCPACSQTVRVRRKFDQFVISRRLGEGGMSRVFDAVDETLGRHVALKILNRRYSKSAERIAQFEKEAQLTAAVTHPNVVKLFSVGYDQGNFYIAMELVSGGSLESRIQEKGRVEEREALRVGCAVAEGLRSAYREGLIHRDVKPANILFTEENVPKIVDFGLALFHERDVDQSGEIWATPFYVAPEKLTSNKEDFRSDIYSLGASLYHALTGKPPHKADTNSIQELKVIKSRNVRLEDCGFRFSQRTCELINRMLALKPENRFSGYDELVEAFRDAESLISFSEIGQRARRQKLIYAGAAGIGVVVLLGALLRPVNRKKPKSVMTSESIQQEELGKSLLGGRRSVSERFLEARSVLLKGRYEEALKKFQELIRLHEAKQPTLNKARFNAALCAIVAGKQKEAEQYFAAIHADAGQGVDVGAEEGAVYAKIAERMEADLGLEQEVNRKSIDYRTDTEEVLGYLAHGLAQWHFGKKTRVAVDWLKTFNACQLPKSLEWINGYKDLIAPYMKDVAVAESLLAKKRLDVGELVSRTPDEAAKLLAETRQALGQLQTEGVVKRALTKQANDLRGKIAQMKRDAQRAEIARLSALRIREAAQWTDIVGTLPALVRGYDVSLVVGQLKSIQPFEAPEVQAAVANKLYIWSKAEEFMQTLMDDVKRNGYNGHLQRRTGISLDGTLSKLTYTDATVVLERGDVVVPTESLAPDLLVTMAQKYCESITDSTDFYRRQELIVVFAKVQGLDEMANAVASQLMEENRAFRHRWMKVAQAGGL